MKCLFMLIPLLVACERTAFRPSSDVTFKNSALYYQGTLFTGILEERFDAVGTIRKTHYVDGFQDGLQEERTFNGGLVARGNYSHGNKVGIQEGWHVNGNRRFHHEYNKSGFLDGEVWEWHPSGKLFMYEKMSNGSLLAKKMWRENGQIYMNFVFQDGKPMGLPGAQLCNQVRGDEFIANKKKPGDQGSG